MSATKISQDFRVGQDVSYYHAFLDETIPARVKRITRSHVVIDLSDWAELGAPRLRKLTHKQASQSLS